MDWKEYFKGFVFFWKGLKAAKKEMWVSIQVLLVLTFVLSLLLYPIEHNAQPEVYHDWWDGLVWGFMSYLGNPGKFSPGEPITLLGRYIAVIISIVKILIFAVPAGLVANGFRNAMENDKREKELKEYHKIMLRAFPVGVGKNLRNYLSTLPKDENAWYAGCNFGYIVNNVNVSKFDLKGMSLKDILDVCKEYPEFRVKNEASAMSIEGEKRDRYMLEHFPVNRRYGFFADRGSKVTIVSTSSQAELSTGNFSYYLAKFAGFNYISKDFNAADGESYYNNHWKEPFYEGLTLQEREDKKEKISKEVEKAYEDKKALRDAFVKDLKTLCSGEGKWVICLLSHVQNQENKTDIHFAHSLADGSCSTITDKEKYDELLSSLSKNLQDELQLSVEETTRFPFVKRGTYRNIAYMLQDEGCKCNVLTIRVSSNLMEFDSRMRVAQFIMAKTIHDVIEPEHRLKPEEIADMNRTSRFHGFADQEVDKIKGTLFKAE